MDSPNCRDDADWWKDGKPDDADDESDQDDGGPGEFDAHLLDDSSTSTVPCIECGEEIYDEATICPHCGYHFTHSAYNESGRRGQGKYKQLKGVVIALIIIILISGVAAAGFLLWH